MFQENIIWKFPCQELSFIAISYTDPTITTSLLFAIIVPALFDQ